MAVAVRASWRPARWAPDALRLKIAGNEGDYAFSFDTGDGQAGNCLQARWMAPF